jgi:hypothetical protein
MNLPPLLFLVLGGVLLAFGCVRAFVWGFKAGRRGIPGREVNLHELADV